MNNLLKLPLAQAKVYNKLVREVLMTPYKDKKISIECRAGEVRTLRALEKRGLVEVNESDLNGIRAKMVFKEPSKLVVPDSETTALQEFFQLCLSLRESASKQTHYDRLDEWRKKIDEFIHGELDSAQRS